MNPEDRPPSPCPRQLCHNGACRTADLGPLLSPNVRWLWEQVALRADRRADTAMDSGTLTITTPTASEQRAAVIGLLAPHPYPPRATRRINLGRLTQSLHHHGPDLTPGAVAAHALGRPLAPHVADEARLAARLTSLQHLRRRLARALPSTAPVRPDDAGWDTLRQRGTLARLLQHPYPEQLLSASHAVLRLLPATGRADRRLLAHAATGDPHKLDAGSDLACLVLAEAAAHSGGTDTALPRREAWDRLGVDLDTLTGGLLTLGIHPQGWHLLPTAPIVLPPCVLHDARGPAPKPDERPWVFLTENPSVAAAARTLPGPVRLLCTAGTPSGTELQALARLAAAGWCIAARADFDSAGLALLRAVLNTVPRALGWRMSAADYTAGLYPAPLRTRSSRPRPPR